MLSATIALVSMLAAASPRAAPPQAKTISACRPAPLARAEARITKAWANSDYETAARLAKRLLDRCGQTLTPVRRDSLLIQLASLRYDVWDEAGCLAVLETLDPSARQAEARMGTEAAAVSGTRDKRMAIATEARSLLRLCSHPRVEDNPALLLGRPYKDIEEIDPGLDLTSACDVSGPQGGRDLRLFSYRKARWRESKRSRDKELYVLAEIVSQKDTIIDRVKAVDVLYIDLDHYPAGALQVGGGAANCTRRQYRDNLEWNVVGVFPDQGPGKIVTPYKAWIADGEAGRFVPLDPAKVGCQWWPEHDD